MRKRTGQAGHRGRMMDHAVMLMKILEERDSITLEEV